MHEISVNGEPKQIPFGLSVEGLLAHLGVSADRVAVELNRAIVRKRDWAGTQIPASAKVEIVEFVGGG